MDKAEKFIPAMNDDKAQVGPDTAQILGEEGDSGEISASTQALHDDDELVRENARESLEQPNVEVESKTEKVHSRKWIRAIAVLETLGGIVGILLIVTTFSIVGRHVAGVLILLLFIGLYALNFVAGWLLWKNRPRGIGLSILVQAFQIPYFSVPVLRYYFTSGLAVLVYVRTSASEFGFKLDIELLSSAGLHFGHLEPPFLLGLNISALVILQFLLKQRRSMSLQDATA